MLQSASIHWMTERAMTPFGQTVPGVMSGGFDPLDGPLTLKEVEALYYDNDFRGSVSPLRESYRRVSVVRDQQLVDPGEYVLLEDAKRIRQQDVTVKLHVAHRYMEGAREVGQQLTDATGLPVHATVYLSTTGRQGVPLHSDADSVFALQVEGEKTWLFFPPRATDPHDVDNVGWILEDGKTESVAPRNTAAYEFTVCPGDILYVPRGWGHYALAQGPGSLHMSLGVLHPEVDQTKVALQEPLTPQTA